MHDLDKPYTDSIQQWDIACDCFKAEFKFDPNEIVTIDTIREMFAELVDNHESPTAHREAETAKAHRG